MRFDRLDLIHWGGLSNVSLDLSGGTHGLHVVYGDNEAGKSTTRRAISAVLFGIPAQTLDRFRFDYKTLRLGASVRLQDGRSFAFRRRKGTKDTMIDALDAPLSDAPLRAALGGLDRETFEQEWSLDHERLREGASALLRGEGELGQSLLAAGLGGIGIGALQADLEEEAREIFGKRGGSTITRLLGQIQDKRKARDLHAVSELSIEGESAKLEELLLERQTLETERDERAEEMLRIDRVERARSVLAQHDQALRELEAMKGVPPLGAEFSKRRALAEQACATAREDLLRAQEEVQRIEERLRVLVSDGKGPVTATHTGREALVGVAQGDFRRLHERARALAEAETEIRTKLTTFRADHANAVADHSGLAAKSDQAGPPPEDDRALQLAFERARTELAGAGKRVASADKNVLERTAVASEAFESLDRWARGPLGRRALETARLPTARQIDEHEAALGAEGSLRAARERELLAKEELRVRTATVKGLSLREVASPVLVTRAREQRDAGWALVRASLERVALPEATLREFTRGKSLADAYEAAVAQADRLADTLGEGATQASHLSTAMAERDAAETRLARLVSERSDLEKASSAARAAWNALWRPYGIQPDSPQTMQSWLAAAEAVRGSLADEQRARAELAVLLAHAEKEIAPLAAALGTKHAAPRDVDALLAKAAEDLRRVGEARQARGTIERELGRAQERVADLSEKISAEEERATRVRLEWQGLLRQLGLDEATTPKSVLDVLGASLEIATERHRDQERKASESRLEAARILALEKAQRSAEAAVVLDRICDEAGTRDPGELARIQEADERRRELVGRRDGSLATLSMVAPNGLASLREEALTFPSETAVVRRQAAEAARDALASRINDVNQAIGAAKHELAKATGSALAADDESEIQGLIASVGDAALEHVRLVFAAELLGRAAERYREKHQSPILRRTSELLDRLTAGSFSAVVVDEEESGRSLIKGVRGVGAGAGGGLVGVEGMSDGTRDQLFLAIRLAALEEQLKGREPLPFVVDDILINLSDGRAAAALDVLGELATRTQVLLFTHHTKVVELAEALHGREVFVHRLAPGAASGANPGSLVP